MYWGYYCIYEFLTSSQVSASFWRQKAVDTIVSDSFWHVSSETGFWRQKPNPALPLCSQISTPSCLHSPWPHAREVVLFNFILSMHCPRVEPAWCKHVPTETLTWGLHGQLVGGEGSLSCPALFLTCTVLDFLHPFSFFLFLSLFFLFMSIVMCSHKPLSILKMLRFQLSIIM